VNSKERSATTKTQKNYSFYYWTKTSCICSNVLAHFLFQHTDSERSTFVIADNSDDGKICVSSYTTKKD